MEKKCIRCNENKVLSSFHKHKNCADGHKPICKLCYLIDSKKYTKKWYEKNKDKHMKDASQNSKNCLKKLEIIKKEFLKGKSCHICNRDVYRLIPKLNNNGIRKTSYWNEKAYREALESSEIICKSCLGKASYKKRKKNDLLSQTKGKSK